MVLTIDSITEDLDFVVDRLLAERLNIGTVGHLNSKTKELGNYFSNLFDCELVNLPSVTRRGRNRTLAIVANSVYPFLPESTLKILSEQYKKVYTRSERVFPVNFDWEQLTPNDSEILLVDDNALTGSTLEMWKKEIQDRTGRGVKTFSITVTGDYRPDYFCIEGWRSFKWRPIGI